MGAKGLPGAETGKVARVKLSLNCRHGPSPGANEGIPSDGHLREEPPLHKTHCFFRPVKTVPVCKRYRAWKTTRRYANEPTNFGKRLESPKAKKNTFGTKPNSS